MCFSATASFGVAAVLIPAGIYTIKKSTLLDKPYWIIALFPFIFAIQQFLEGFVWLGIDSDEHSATRLAALGFIFISHVFWLTFVPLSCYVVENNPIKRKAFLFLTIFGSVVGLLMYIPLWVNQHWLVIEVVNHSIVYHTALLFDPYVSKTVGRVVYALLILVPLLLSSDRHINVFGIFIAVSAAIFSLYFEYAFVSLWCFFSAILSLFILSIILHKTKAA